MVCSTNAETTGGCSVNLGGPITTSREKVYGYLDLFKSMGDSLPLQTYQMTLTKVVIGRDSDCQIRIKNSRVSRQQCAVIVVYDNHRNLEVRLKNLTLRSTTALKGKSIGPGEEIVLQHGDRFRLYEVELRYRLYDPVNEQGQLDWTRPLPVVKLSTATNSPPPETPKLPLIKVTGPVNEAKPKLPPHSLNVRRQSLPLPTSITNNSKMDYLKLPRRNSTPVDDSSRKQAELDAMNNNRNKKPGSNAYKRRGSSDFDMRRAVLQRSFRRAFKEKISQGSFIDVNDGRFRKALEDFVVLSSAA